MAAMPHRFVAFRSLAQSAFPSRPRIVSGVRAWRQVRVCLASSGSPQGRSCFLRVASKQLLGASHLGGGRRRAHPRLHPSIALPADRSRVDGGSAARCARRPVPVAIDSLERPLMRAFVAARAARAAARQSRARVHHQCLKRRQPLAAAPILDEREHPRRGAVVQPEPRAELTVGQWCQLSLCASHQQRPCAARACFVVVCHVASLPIESTPAWHRAQRRAVRSRRAFL